MTEAPLFLITARPPAMNVWVYLNTDLGSKQERWVTNPRAATLFTLAESDSVRAVISQRKDWPDWARRADVQRFETVRDMRNGAIVNFTP